MKEYSKGMSKYSFSDSIRDHATLPLNFEPVPVDLRVDRDTMDREFDILTRDLPDSDKAELSKRVNMQAIMYNEKRIHKVCAHIAKHFTEKIRPNGYKAQVVVYDRPCCLKYKAELDKLLGEECSTIVMDTNDDKADEYKKYRRSKDEEAKILDRFRDPIKAVLDGGVADAIAEIDEKIKEKQKELLEAGHDDALIDSIGAEIIDLREEHQDLMTTAAKQQELQERLEDLDNFLDEQTEAITEYSEALVRRLIEKITVYDEKLVVEFKSGLQIEVEA